MLIWEVLVNMDLGEKVVEENNIEGDLRGSTSPIIKIRIRSHNGTPQHRAEFRLSDTKSLVNELNILKDKFGVGCFIIKSEYSDKYSKQLVEEVTEETKRLTDWREKTKGLREDKDFTQKMKDAFKK